MGTDGNRNRPARGQGPGRCSSQLDSSSFRFLGVPAPSPSTACSTAPISQGCGPGHHAAAGGLTSRISSVLCCLRIAEFSPPLAQQLEVFSAAHARKHATTRCVWCGALSVHILDATFDDNTPMPPQACSPAPCNSPRGASPYTSDSLRPAHALALDYAVLTLFVP